MELNKNKPNFKILFQSWTQIPHSYSLVNCFQLIHLYKNYGPMGKNKIDIYIEEMPYYRKEWNDKKKLVYSEEYNNIIKNLKIYNGEEIDLIYRITYPYNITINPKHINIPKCVFYTSEFRDYLTPDYFTSNLSIKNDIDIESFIKKFQDTFYFTSPSEWSSKGLEKYSVKSKYNRIITHGVDSSIFKNDKKNRDIIREKYNIKKTDILLISSGAMTKNKGILLILPVLNILVNKLKKIHFKLILKGTGDLYQSKAMLENYFEELLYSNVITQQEINILYNHIIFMDKTLSYTVINDLYNASDIYLSPYLCEGFGLTPLEALRSGLNVVVPITGSTKEYMDNIYKNGGKGHIFYVNSQVIRLENSMCQNNILIQDLFNTIIDFENVLIKERLNKNNEINIKNEQYNTMCKYIDKELSWNKVSDLLMNYFEYIINQSSFQQIT